MQKKKLFIFKSKAESNFKLRSAISLLNFNFLLDCYCPKLAWQIIKS
jgi:hypothetical protein